MPRSYASSARFDNGAAAGGDRATLDGANASFVGRRRPAPARSRCYSCFRRRCDKRKIVVGVLTLYVYYRQLVTMEKQRAALEREMAGRMRPWVGLFDFGLNRPNPPLAEKGELLKVLLAIQVRFQRRRRGSVLFFTRCRRAMANQTSLSIGKNLIPKH
jgi:hypothetical protein